jgi:hypothetical protein
MKRSSASPRNPRTPAPSPVASNSPPAPPPRVTACSSQPPAHRSKAPTASVISAPVLPASASDPGPWGLRLRSKRGGIWSAVASAARHRFALRRTTSAARRRPPWTVVSGSGGAALRLSPDEKRCRAALATALQDRHSSLNSARINGVLRGNHQLDSLMKHLALLLVASLPVFAQQPSPPPKGDGDVGPAATTSESPEVFNARMAWWREAKFGMFLHWGAYSRAAGEWKGHHQPRRMAPVHRQDPAGGV